MSEEKKYDIEQIKRENAVLRQYAAVQKAGEDTISVQKIYVDIAGSLEAGFILDELIYFTLPRDGGKSGLRVWKNGFLWMAVSRTEWWERKRLTERQADHAIEKLIEKNLIFKELHLFNSQKTTHLRLNTPEFFKLYKEKLAENNPPEDDGDTMLQDISDLYEMMGIPKSDTPIDGYPKKGDGITKGDTVSQKGDSLNIPHASPTQPEESPVVLTEEEIAEANHKVDEILRLNQGRNKDWEGRFYFRDNHLAYADWWHEKTNQICKKRAMKSWQKAFSDWQDEGLDVSHLQESYAQDIEWKKIISDPNELTKKAVAIKALSAKRPNSNNRDGWELDDHGAPISY